MNLIKGDFSIIEQNQQKALEAIQYAIRTRSWIVDAVGNQQRVELTSISIEDALAATSLTEVFALFGWRLITSQEQTVLGIAFCEETGKYIQDDELLFALVAPFVEVGCIEVDGIDRDGYIHWQWQFTGVRCRSVLEDDEDWNALLDERLNPETLPEIEFKIEFLGNATLRSHDPMQARKRVKTLIEMAIKQLEDSTLTMYIASLDATEHQQWEKGD